MNRILLITGALLIFGTVNWQIAGKERLRANGQVVYLVLAPIDPRSLMQGDYMALNFAVSQEIGQALTETKPESGVAILKLDNRRVATFARLDNGGALDPGEVRFRFRYRQGAVWLGTNAFFFHEGDEDRYAGARFGEFRINGDGDAMLVELRNMDLQPLSNQH